MIKDEQFRDEPPNPDWDGVNPLNSLLHIYTADRPEVHELIRAMRAVLDEYDERMMVGEIYLPNDELATYFGADHDEVHLPFNFQLIRMPWDAQTVRRAVDAYEASLPAGALAQLGAGQSRPEARRQPRRTGAGARGEHDAADAARHADHLLRRGTGDGERAHPAGDDPGPARGQPAGDCRRGGARPGAHAHAVGRLAQRRLHRSRRHAVAAARRRLSHAQRGRPVRKSALHAQPLPRADPNSAAPSLRCTAARIAPLDAGTDDMFAYVRSAPGWGQLPHRAELQQQVTYRWTSATWPAAWRRSPSTTGMDRAGKIGPGRLMLDPNEGLVLRLG